MKYILFLTFSFLFTFNSFAQYTAVKVDLDYLRKQIMPDLEIQQQKFAAYSDSIYQAEMNSDKVKTWKKQGENVNSSDQEEQYIAMKAMSSFQNFEYELMKRMQLEAGKWFEELNIIVKTVAEVAEEKGVDIVFYYTNAEGVVDIEMDDNTEYTFRRAAEKCMTGEPRPTNPQEKEVYQEKFRTCLMSALQPFLDGSTDFTALISQKMGK